VLKEACLPDAGAGTKRNFSVAEERDMMKLNHSWLMVLCVVGMGSVFILPALGISLGSVGTLWLILLCPLSHLLIMRRGHGSHGRNDKASGSGEPLASPVVTGDAPPGRGEPPRVKG